MSSPSETQTIEAASPEDRLLNLLRGAWVTQAIYLMVKLRIVDLLTRRAQTTEELASNIGCSLKGLEALLQFLAAYELVTPYHDVFDDRGTVWSLSELGNLLRADMSAPMRERALEYGSFGYQTWAELEYTVRTGQPGFEKAYDQSFWDHLADDPEAAEIFDRHMRKNAQLLASVISTSLDVLHASPQAIIVDVGGGRGVMLEAILAAHPQARGVLVDLPHVVEAAEKQLADTVRARCAFVPSDMRQVVPPGGDLYLLSRVLHDWDDEQCRQILGACRAAMGSPARLLIVEQVVRKPGELSAAARRDVASRNLNMLVTFGGRERTIAEYEELLGQTGFEVASQELLAYSPHELHLIEARPTAPRTSSGAEAA